MERQGQWLSPPRLVLLRRGPDQAFLKQEHTLIGHGLGRRVPGGHAPWRQGAGADYGLAEPYRLP